MSESMSSPWIRDYLINVAETYGAQLHNVPVSNKKRRVQLTDLLTYHEDSYVWACVSDKDYRVSVRISKDAADQYKRDHGRSVIDSRFFPVFVNNYRPMFSPRPIGPNASGNTPVSHISLEIGSVSSIGIGGHLFGNPRDLESDENIKEWVQGLRQDGGGGNVLKLRKQQDLVQNKKIPPSPPPPPPISRSLACQDQRTKAADDVAKPEHERLQDFKRAYAKRWRKVEVDPWKFATKPAVEERPMQEMELSHCPVEPLLGAASQLEARGPLVCPTSPHRTPSPTSLRPRGTPTDWSPSNRGSPVAADESTFGNGIQQHDEPEVLPVTSHLPSDTEGHTTADTAITSDIRSLQPPTPAQRIKRSPIRRSSSPPRSSPEPSACSSPRSFQQLPRSSPPPPSSSLPLPSSTFPTPMGIRKNIQRKVPHPGLPFSRPDPTKQGPVQILVPNSDASGTGSSQSYSQSQHISQSQQYQPQLLSHSPAFPSSLAKEFKPADASTPREEMLVDTSMPTSKMSAESSPIHGDVDEQDTTSVGDKYTTAKADANAGKQGSGSNRHPAPSAPKIEVLEVGKFDTEEETNELQSTHSTVRTEVELDTHNKTHDTGEGDADADHEDNQLSVDEIQRHPARQSSPRQPSRLSTAEVIQHPAPNKQSTDGVLIHRSTQSSEPSGSRSSMYSLFSDSLGDERAVSSHAAALPVGRTEDKVEEKAGPAHVPRHDPESWKEPSFIAKNKGKGKARAVEELDTPSVKVGKKRRPSAQHELPVPKRAKVTAPEVHRATSNRATTENLGHMQLQDTEASVVGRIHSNNRPSTSPRDTTETTTPSPTFPLSKPRLANFVVDFERIDLGKGVPIPRLDLEKDIKGVLLTTGRIRTIGEEIENDGSVYIIR